MPHLLKLQLLHPKTIMPIGNYGHSLRKKDMAENKERHIVESFIKFYNAFQIPEMVELFADDCVFENISNSSGSLKCHGKEELLKLAKGCASYFQERKLTTTNWIFAKDKVVVEIEYTSILAQDFPNGLKKGDTFKLKGVSVYEFENSKIKRLADYS